MTPGLKPAGGIAAVRLTPAANLAAEGEGAVRVVDSSNTVAIPVICRRGTYSEKAYVTDGFHSVAQRLAITASRDDMQEWLEADFRQQTLAQGMAALVELTDGETLAAGYDPLSSKVVLRLTEFETQSGAKGGDYPEVRMVLECRTTCHAPHVTAE